MIPRHKSSLKLTVYYSGVNFNSWVDIKMISCGTTSQNISKTNTFYQKEIVEFTKKDYQLRRAKSEPNLNILLSTDSGLKIAVLLFDADTSSGIHYNAPTPTHYGQKILHNISFELSQKQTQQEIPVVGKMISAKVTLQNYSNFVVPALHADWFATPRNNIKTHLFYAQVADVSLSFPSLNNSAITMDHIELCFLFLRTYPNCTKYSLTRWTRNMVFIFLGTHQHSGTKQRKMKNVLSVETAFGDSLISWTKAQTHCSRVGGSLPITRDKQEFDLLMLLVRWTLLYSVFPIQLV